MTPAASILRDEIARQGAVSFHRFMEVALYHPEFGYYRRGRDPFGRQGDYFTAEQIQPVFGILIAARIRQLCEELGNPPDFTVVELGAGRAEMAEAFSGLPLLPRGRSPPANGPRRFTGVVFSNEFFDALPVDAAVRRRRRLPRDARRLARGTFRVGGRAAGLGRAAPSTRNATAATVEDGAWVEINLEALRWMERDRRAASSAATSSPSTTATRRASWYGFPRGTLMSYRRHVAQRGRAHGSGRARHHRARPLHGAPGPRRAPRAGDRALREPGADARWPPASPTASRRRLRRDAAPSDLQRAAPAQDVAVRDGGDVSHAAAAEGGRAIKKAPISRGLG